MLELGGSQTPDQTPAAAGELIKDGTEATFMADVIEGSRETPVIVDFWATWCGPCKTLTPMLEAAVTAAKGKVRLIKIDVDKEQRLAGALAQQGLPLQSIPTVVAFFGGQPVDMFQGAIPQGQMNEFVAVRAQIALARQAENAGPLAELSARVDAAPDDLQARFDYALALHAAGQVQEAVDQLLDLFRRDREWNDGAAKAQLFTIFEALPPQDPIALSGRRKLSSMIFA
jgi:thioredoxin